MKSKMTARGKFKSRNLFRLLLLLNVTFPLSNKICNLDIIWSNLASTRANRPISSTCVNLRLRLARALVSSTILQNQTLIVAFSNCTFV